MSLFHASCHAPCSTTHDACRHHVHPDRGVGPAQSETRKRVSWSVQRRGRRKKKEAKQVVLDRNEIKSAMNTEDNKKEETTGGKQDETTAGKQHGDPGGKQDMVRAPSKYRLERQQCQPRPTRSSRSSSKSSQTTKDRHLHNQNHSPLMPSPI